MYFIIEATVGKNTHALAFLVLASLLLYQVEFHGEYLKFLSRNDFEFTVDYPLDRLVSDV